MPRSSEPRVRSLMIHGHRRAFLQAGRGPAVLLLHGLGCDHTTWSPAIEQLSRRFTVIAPDSLGHGASDKPRADYTLGGYANGMRDLLAVLGIDRVTVVGTQFRRRCRHAVRLPVPAVHGAFDAGRSRRPRARGASHHAGADAPGCIRCPRGGVRPADLCDRPIPRSSVPTPPTCRVPPTFSVRCQCSPANRTRRSAMPSSMCCGPLSTGAGRWSR